jgi:hypothetical protein
MLKEIHHDYPIQKGQYYIRYQKDFNNVTIFLVEEGGMQNVEFQKFVFDRLFEPKGTKFSLVKFYEPLIQITIAEITVTV